jgi:hypothetical protein
MRRFVPLGLTMIALAGCGASEERQVRDTMDAANRAFLDGDGKKVCSLLTPETRDTVGEFEGDCASAIERARSNVPANVMSKAFAKTHIRSVKITGRAAVVEYEGGLHNSTLRKMAGRWLIEGYEI